MKVTKREEAIDPTTPSSRLAELASEFPEEVAKNPNADIDTLFELVGRCAKDVLQNPILPLLCQEDPSQGMLLTAKALDVISFDRIQQAYWNADTVNVLQWKLFCLRRIYPYWRDAYPTDRSVEKALQTMNSYISLMRSGKLNPRFNKEPFDIAFVFTVNPVFKVFLIELRSALSAYISLETSSHCARIKADILQGVQPTLDYSPPWLMEYAKERAAQADMFVGLTPKHR